MLQSTVFQVASAVVMGLLMVAEAAPATPAACLGFRITSPTQGGLHWTYGQCYQVSWDLGASKVKQITKIDLIDASTKKKVYTEIQNVAGSKGYASFPLLLGGDNADIHSGNYYFQVTASTSVSGVTCTDHSSTFYVEVNPNSPPEDHCPQ